LGDNACRVVRYSEKRTAGLEVELAQLVAQADDLDDGSSSDVCGLPAQEHPGKRGIKVSQLTKFYEEIKDDLREYCNGHSEFVNDCQRMHVCMSQACPYGDHRGVPYICAARVPANVVIRKMSPNTRTVFDRYVQPGKHCCVRSTDFHTRESGFAFISHSWSADFGELVRTVDSHLGPDDVIWLDMFALDWRERAAGGCRDSSDEGRHALAVALWEAQKVVLIVDRGLDSLRRLWSVHQLFLAVDQGVPLVAWPRDRVRAAEARGVLSGLRACDAYASDDEGSQEALRVELAAEASPEVLRGRVRAALQLAEAVDGLPPDVAAARESAHVASTADRGSARPPCVTTRRGRRDSLERLLDGRMAAAIEAELGRLRSKPK